MREINSKSVTFTHDNKYLLFIAVKSGFTMWNIREKKIECCFSDLYEYMAISSDGQNVLLHVRSIGTYLFNIKLKNIEQYCNYCGENFAIATHNNVFYSFIRWSSNFNRLNLNENEKESITITGKISRAAITSYGDFLIFSDLNTLKLVSLHSTERVFSFSGHCKEVAKVIVTFDGAYIASLCFGNTVRLWSIKEGNEEAVFYSSVDASQWIERYRELSYFFESII